MATGWPVVQHIREHIISLTTCQQCPCVAMLQAAIVRTVLAARLGKIGQLVLSLHSP